jgi:putative endonuclease
MAGLDDFRRLPHTRARGKLGEEEAASWLEARGYRILERNLRNRAGEIDLIAEEAGTLCFLEIKARASREYGLAIEAISPAKQKRLARAASLHLACHPWAGPCRFDVLGMDLTPEGWVFTLIRNAFEG